MPQSKEPVPDQKSEGMLSFEERPRSKQLTEGTKDKPTFTQLIGWKFGIILLWVILGFAVVTAAAWWLTQPTLEEIKSLLPTPATGDDIRNLVRDLQNDHFQRYRDVFQLFVISTLVPLFTLVVGYAFGARERQNNSDSDGDES
jgi:hypothetical protein